MSWVAVAAAASEPVYRVGDKVVTKDRCTIVVGGEVVGYAFPGWVYDVQRVDKDALWVPAKTPGWIKRRNVIPFDDAVLHFSKRIERNPDDREAFRARSLVLMAQHKLEEAIADFTVLIEQDPNDGTVWNDRGRAWMLLGHADAAIADYTSAIELRPYAVYFNNRAIAWEDKGEYAKAADDWHRATNLRPEFYYPHRSLARLYAACPDKNILNGQKAIRHATKACELSEWRDQNDLVLLSAAYATAGDLDGAIEWQIKANELGGSEKDAKFGQDRLNTLRQLKQKRAPRQFN
jgi:tetratricopeptide (TPR) repeat protein